VRKYRLGKEKADWARGLLRASVNKLPEHRFLHRLHCVVLVAEGHSCADVARWFGGTRRTIERWVHSFEADGIEGLREQHHGGGRSSRLTESRLRELAVDLDRPPVVSGYPDRQWSGRLVALHVARRYGVTLQPRQCQRILREARGVATSVPTQIPTNT